MGVDYDVRSKRRRSTHTKCCSSAVCALATPRSTQPSAFAATTGRRSRRTTTLTYVVGRPDGDASAALCVFVFVKDAGCLSIDTARHLVKSKLRARAARRVAARSGAQQAACGPCRQSPDAPQRVATATAPPATAADIQTPCYRQRWGRFAVCTVVALLLSSFCRTVQA